MRLFYRGASYECEPAAVDMVQSGIQGQYRGQTVHFSYPRHIPVPQATHQLSYRGVAYRTTPTGVVQSVPSSRPAVGKTELDTVLLYTTKPTRKLVMSDVERIHRQNIQRRLVHRLEVARAKGDTSLVHELEREMQLT